MTTVAEAGAARCKNPDLPSLTKIQAASRSDQGVASTRAGSKTGSEGMSQPLPKPPAHSSRSSLSGNSLGNIPTAKSSPLCVISSAAAISALYRGSGEWRRGQQQQGLQQGQQRLSYGQLMLLHASNASASAQQNPPRRSPCGNEPGQPPRLGSNLTSCRTSHLSGLSGASLSTSLKGLSQAGLEQGPGSHGPPVRRSLLPAGQLQSTNGRSSAVMLALMSAARASTHVLMPDHPHE